MTKIDKEDFHKEIDLIQSCINRMANNSFLIKGWAISIIAIVLTVVDKNVSLPFLCIITLLPLISFWYLDAFFLYTERLYRKIYEWVIVERPKENSDFMFDLNPHRFIPLRDTNDKKITIWSVMFSKTLIPFYGIPVLLVVLYLIFFKI